MLINPALNVPAYEHLKEATHPRFIVEEKPDLNVKNVYKITYDLVPVKAIHELQKIMEMTPASLPFIQCPILGIRSAIDHVVPPENTDFIIEHIDQT